jgi:hypothetical protein
VLRRYVASKCNAYLSINPTALFEAIEWYDLFTLCLLKTLSDLVLGVVIDGDNMVLREIILILRVEGHDAIVHGVGVTA